MFDVSLHRRSEKRARQGRKMTSNLCLTSAQLVLHDKMSGLDPDAINKEKKRDGIPRKERRIINPSAIYRRIQTKL